MSERCRSKDSVDLFNLKSRPSPSGNQCQSARCSFDAGGSATPFGKNMQQTRFGRSVSDFESLPADIPSRNGKPRAIPPAPRKTSRRFRCQDFSAGIGVPYFICDSACARLNKQFTNWTRKSSVSSSRSLATPAPLRPTETRHYFVRNASLNAIPSISELTR